jgi:hypothetical protein
MRHSAALQGQPPGAAARVIVTRTQLQCATGQHRTAQQHHYMAGGLAWDTTAETLRPSRLASTSTCPPANDVPHRATRLLSTLPPTPVS